MRYGIFGGSFDPFHKGHMSMIKGALKSKAVDRILVIPSGMSPFKKDKTATPAIYRYYMTKTALAGMEYCEVLPVELLQEGASYTIESVLAIKEMPEYKDASEWYLLCGTDILAGLTKWHRIGDILGQLRLLVAKRPGVEGKTAHTQAKKIEETYSTKITFFSIKGIETASSEMKKERRFTDAPASVREFIKRHNLYPRENPLAFLDEKTCDLFLKCQPKLFCILSPNRVLHSLNTAILSVFYARCNNLNPDKAFIAGLLHDCAKELPIHMQRELAYKETGTIEKDEGIIHAPAGARYAREHFGIRDTEILDAICYHTIGRKNMTEYDKITFLADKLEPARRYTDLADLRKWAVRDLDKATLMCMERVKASYTRNKAAFHPQAQEAIDDMIDFLKKRREMSGNQ